MAKRNIEVKEKSLIDKLNKAVEGKKPYETPTANYVWDNNGPVQFVTNEDKFFNEDVKVEPKTVCLTPRNEDGSFMEHYDETICDSKDNADSRASNSKQNDLTYIEKMRKTLVEARNKDTQMRTPINRARDIEKAMVDAELKPLKEKYEEVNHPDHYNQYDVEVIDMMEKIFGKEETASFCKLSAFKYRLRMGNKPGQDITKDLAKEKWYLTKKKELEGKI